jgi:hypothetical protein
LGALRAKRKKLEPRRTRRARRKKKKESLKHEGLQDETLDAILDNVVKKPKTAIVIPRSLRRGISTFGVGPRNISLLRNDKHQNSTKIDLRRPFLTPKLGFDPFGRICNLLIKMDSGSSPE